MIGEPRRSAIVVVVWLVGFSGAIVVGCGDEEQREQSVLDLVSALAEDPPMTAAQASQALGVELPKNEAASTQFYDLHVMNVHDRSFMRVEYRVSVSPHAAQGITLILDVRPDPCVTKREVAARFGDRPEQSIPPPEAPEDAPVHHVYRGSFGSLHFGFARGGRECLVEVILDTGA